MLAFVEAPNCAFYFSTMYFTYYSFKKCSSNNALWLKSANTPHTHLCTLCELEMAQKTPCNSAHI